MNVAGEASDQPPPPTPPRDGSATPEGPAGSTRTLGLAGDPPGPIVAGDDPATAARKALWIHAARLLERDVAVRGADHADDLRKYRVATRRLRSALRIFGFALPAGPAERLHRGLGELASGVGAVRDADVRIESGLAWQASVKDGGDATSLEPLLEDWRGERAKAHARLIRRLDSKRHRRLLERLVAFVGEPTGGPDAGDASGADVAGAPTIRDRVASRVWAAYEPIRAREDAVRSADLATLHRLRIRTKRLRYLLEFLADILGTDGPELVALLTALQDHLGAINDTAVTVDAVRAFVERRGATLQPAQAAAIGAYLADRERELVRLRVSLGAAFRPVVGLSFARRLGRTVVIA